MTNSFKNKLHEIIRVDHAGEMGAKVIYSGQIAALKLKKSDKRTIDLVEHMKEQEDEHFDFFDKKMKVEKVRPTIMQPIWKVGGFALGFLTALADDKAAMTCTTAVEEVIDEHYQDQLKEIQEAENSLNNEEKIDIQELKKKIIKFREEELEHRDIGYEEKAAELKYFDPLSKFIKSTTKLAIAVSKRI